MIVVLILFVIIVLLLAILFFMPFYIEINSKKKLFRIRFRWLASAIIDLSGGSVVLLIKVLWFEKKIDLLERRNTRDEKLKLVNLNLKKKETRVSWRRVKSVLASFKVNKCDISIDSGDMQLNGIMYPLFYLLSVRSRKNIRINFIGENEVAIEIENSLARMSWAFISS